MKINLTEKQRFDIEWSILIALHTVEQERKKEKKDKLETAENYEICEN